jgi:hypothetical protein
VLNYFSYGIKPECAWKFVQVLPVRKWVTTTLKTGGIRHYEKELKDRI